VIFGAKWEIELNFLYSKMNALSGRASQVLIWLEGWEKLDPTASTGSRAHCALLLCGHVLFATLIERNSVDAFNPNC
jgi:hypothetical protein